MALTMHVLSSCVLLASGLAFLACAGPGNKDAGLLAGASFLLAAARLQYLALPGASIDWVTPGVGMRVAAYALLLAVALRQDARSRQEAKWAAISAERERIARDLHDGLAQDLAVIAAHGPQLLSELGPEHPLVIAARRTLAASRGAIVDLSASAAPTTGAALRVVADELEARFDVEVNVRVRRESGQLAVADFGRAEREEVVRIAREAIVNAVQHGGARRIDVELDYGGPELLRVSDDGCGISTNPVRALGGFGLPTMRARAESIGGRLVARRRSGGGTELEVRVL
jgi:signal transduction histidine kinase